MQTHSCFSRQMYITEIDGLLLFPVQDYFPLWKFSVGFGSIFLVFPLFITFFRLSAVVVLSVFHEVVIQLDSFIQSIQQITHSKQFFISSCIYSSIPELKIDLKY
ncbi:hypothetical protein Dimus_021833 [Dionaea muscipula]